MESMDLMGYMNSRMEIDARKMLIDEKLAKAEEVAIMTRLGVCEKLLEYYKVISYDSSHVILVKLDDIDTYNSIITVLKI